MDIGLVAAVVGAALWYLLYPVVRRRRKGAARQGGCGGCGMRPKLPE